MYQANPTDRFSNVVQQIKTRKWSMLETVQHNKLS